MNPEKNEEKTNSKKEAVFQSVRGMHDILPKDGAAWMDMWNVGREISELHDFTFMETPILETLGLFEAGVGKMTDIVEKEMFVFKTRGKEDVALRPECTAPIMRSFLQNHLGHFASPLKVFYAGPMFRYERPQAGRYRQFHQWGFEIIGDGDPFYDAEIVLATLHFLSALGLKELRVKINTVGCRVCRPTYQKKLLQHYKANKKELCKDCARRYEENPLRLLDCKAQECRELLSGAPIILDHLCQACNAHLRQVLEFLENNMVLYEPDPHLVRGLDYYSRTVFEVVASDKPETALAGGGRYDYLAEFLGAGRNVPGVGVSIGIERVLEYAASKKLSIGRKDRPSIFFVVVGEEAKKKGLYLIQKLRLARVRTLESVGKKSLENQMRAANKAKAKFVFIFGQRECFEETIIMRNMDSGAQETIPLSRMVEEVKKRLR
ncbi:MAG: histidine--tRNA ligase [Nanoarchaeota archaeon]|nr:histidine--tRNA ligase [Nanoarchaeota archaeon]